MNKWFKVTVKAKKENLTGKHDEKITEQYLFDGLSYTEIEARVYEELKPYFKTIDSIKIDPFKVAELFLDDKGDRYYKCKVNYITLIEKKGKEKKTPAYILVQASSPKEAEALLTEGMKGTMGDWGLEAVVETKIMDVFKYDLKKKSEELAEKSNEAKEVEK